ncbi:MAG: transketolase C-terminal domain-containing protein [Clostridia bacterium]
MKIVYDGQMDPRAFKDVLGATIADILEKDPDAIYLDADLMSCIGTAKYAKSHPSRAIECGIAEANMIGVASGLAAVGFKPIAHSFGTFASRRCFDQAFLSAGYAKNDVTIIGTDPGVCATFNGGTHMPFEDMAIYRALPTATVLDITDTVMLESVLRACMSRPGVKYLRVGRKQAAKVYESGSEITIGQAITLREGSDLTIIACGIMVHEALQAAQALEKEGISARVLDMFTVKPLDEAALVDAARTTGTIVTAENHNRVGGLYAAVAEALARLCPIPVEYVAVEDEFGEVGPQDYLQKRFGLTAQHIVEKAHAALARKR